VQVQTGLAGTRIEGIVDGPDGPRVFFAGTSTVQEVDVGLVPFTTLGPRGDFVIMGPQSGLVDTGLGDDTVRGGPGDDTVMGGAGDDVMNFGEDPARGTYGDFGSNRADGGEGNDQLFGMWDNDTLNGDTGADTLAGQDGDDVLAGGAGADPLFGNARIDHLRGGAGQDPLHGGGGADQFLSMGPVADGPDWVADSPEDEGDILVFLARVARADQFQVNIAATSGAGATDVAEAFAFYRTIGRILWALVDGAGDGAICVDLLVVLVDLLA
jgi:Ca2+-binding RTX toxin-like protein